MSLFARSWTVFGWVLQDEHEIRCIHVFFFLLEYVLIYFTHLFDVSEGRRIYYSFYTAHIRNIQLCGAALLGLMIMFFMSVPCCGCESDWDADKLQHPAKCQSHGGHKWLWAHCRDTLGTLLLCPVNHNLPGRSGVIQMFDSRLAFCSVDSNWIVESGSSIHCSVVNFVSTRQLDIVMYCPC